MDGINTNRIAVDDRALIRRLDISTPVSVTSGEIRYDQRLPSTNFKGMYLYGLPRSSEPGRYWFQLRGSLIKVANNGCHNHDWKDPFAILYALDDLITSLRIDPFKTPLNGLEVSTTIPVIDSRRFCSSIVSYLNQPPRLKMLNRDGYQLPYAEVEARQHKLKMYSPIRGSLRVEVKVNKMQYLGPNRPETFADLAEPRYASLLAAKLLAAFNKIIWKCSGLNINNLTPTERDLYLNGRVPEYWQVDRHQYEDYAEFKRDEKQRSREKGRYNELIERYWLNESPAEIARQLHQQLSFYSDLMHTSVYRTLLEICQSRWKYVGNLPGIIRLPNYLKLPPLSEIYPLCFGKLSTTFPGHPVHNPIMFAQHVNASLGIFDPFETKSGTKLEVQYADNRSNRQSQSWKNELLRLKKVIQKPGGLHWSLAEVSPLLSAKTKITLAQKGLSADALACSGLRPSQKLKSTPLFPS